MHRLRAIDIDIDIDMRAWPHASLGSQAGPYGRAASRVHAWVTQIMIRIKFTMLRVCFQRLQHVTECIAHTMPQCIVTMPQCIITMPQCIHHGLYRLQRADSLRLLQAEAGAGSLCCSSHAGCCEWAELLEGPAQQPAGTGRTAAIDAAGWCIKCMHA